MTPAIEASSLRGVEPDILDADAGKIIWQFDFLGVEDGHVLDFAAIGQLPLTRRAQRARPTGGLLQLAYRENRLNVQPCLQSGLRLIQRFAADGPASGGCASLSAKYWK